MLPRSSFLAVCEIVFMENINKYKQYYQIFLKLDNIFRFSNKVFLFTNQTSIKTAKETFQQIETDRCFKLWILLLRVVQ